jgi:hypothetical protein
MRVNRREGWPAGILFRLSPHNLSPRTRHQRDMLLRHLLVHTILERVMLRLTAVGGGYEPGVPGAAARDDDVGRASASGWVRSQSHDRSGTTAARQAGPSMPLTVTVARPSWSIVTVISCRFMETLPGCR